MVYGTEKCFILFYLWFKKIKIWDCKLNSSKEKSKYEILGFFNGF